MKPPTCPAFPCLVDCSGPLETPGVQPENDGEKGQHFPSARSTTLSALGWMNSLHPRSSVT